MKSVCVYKFSGRFCGKAEYEYRFPEVDVVKKCLLFVAQEDGNVDIRKAMEEIGRYGFVDIRELHGGALQADVLNTDRYRGFAGFYEEALARGSSLVCYPGAPEIPG